MKSASPGFTLVELLVVVAIIATMAAISYPVYSWCLTQARANASGAYLRQIVTANLSYAGDNNGCFCPAQDESNLTRWHGARPSVGAPFDTSKGYLGPYLGTGGIVQRDPLLRSYNVITGDGSWEDGSGGYGYNEVYVGGTPQDNYHGISTLAVPHPASTVMFATTAFAMSGNQIQEYPFCEPPQWVDPNNNLAGSLQPSVHFRANGKALVGWCDGHVTAETQNSTTGPNYYGGNNQQSKIGWFGPTENNGYWNPNYNGP
jgi:prepilin-type N-terminal cleavage/methylation domain-containing protein/prepilin-type processing-associated H-X9-DG protein